MDHGCDRTGPSTSFSLWVFIEAVLVRYVFSRRVLQSDRGVDVFKNNLGVIERRHHVLISALASLAENLTIMVHLVIVCTTGIF